jgi:hypothetical protein
MANAPSHPAPHADTKEREHDRKPAATATAEPKAATATPRDATKDQARMLLLLTTDWLNNDRTHSLEIAALLAEVVAMAGPPVVVDVPFVSQSDGVVNCTMGNWRGEPTSYAYAWQKDGVAISGATSATYTVTADDAGHGLACVVTATNALGSTVAPASNAVVAVFAA